MKRFLVVFMALCMVLCLCACTDNQGNTDADDNTTAATEVTTEAVTEAQAAVAFKVTVVDGEGNPVPGVMVQICKDSCIPAKTDTDGIATFNNIEVTSEHKLSVMACPDGYTYSGEAEIYLEEGMTEYTLELDAQ